MRHASPDLESRIRRYYLFDMLVAFQLWSPFWTLWLFQHANAFQATLVDIVFWTVSLLVMVPAGALADRYGRRPALIVGNAIWVAGIVFFGLATSLPMFALANGVWAFGAAFLWGNVSAYVFDTLAEAGQEARYPRVTSRAAMLTFASTAVAAPLGGVLAYATQHFGMPLLVYAIPGLLALGVATTFREPTVHRAPAQDLVGQIRAGLRVTRQSRAIVLVIVFQVLISVVTYVVAFFRPVFIQELVGEDYILLGLVYGGFFAVAATGGMSIGRLLERLGEAGSLRLTFGLVYPPFVVMFAVGLGLIPGVAGLTLAVLSQIPYYIIWGFEGPVITTIINRRVVSSERATVLAINNFFVTLSLAVFEPVVGLLVEGFGLGTALFLMASAAFVPSAYVVAAYRRHEALPVPVPVPVAVDRGP